MEYKLYTLVDITATGQYRPSTSISDKARWQEQNFNTVLQTIGIRANITYRSGPELLEVRGRLVGFDTDDIIRVWRFDFYTERDHLFENNNDPVGLLLEDLHLVPYIQGLNEAMEQKYAVFNCYDPGKNIAFFIK
jgi:hypothetical protein